MSESQKVFASLSGAFIAHLLLLVLFVVVPRTDSAGSSPANPSRPKAREVTVLMGDLMERLERERLEEAVKTEPEPEPELEPLAPAPRPFVATDLNLPETSAPENARFESDRNTSAAARLRPDTSLPTVEGPTLDGENPLPHLTLANRDFVEGPLAEPPAAPAAPAGMPDSPVLIAVPPSPAAVLPESVANRLGGGVENEAAFSTAPGRDGNDMNGATREKSFVAPGAGVLSSATDGEDTLAAGTGSGKGGEGEPDPLASETEEGAMTGTATVAESNPAEQPAPATNSADTPPATADNGLFAKGFSPEERQNVINGSLAKEGGNAVDAEGTPMGRYKKSVRDAISAKWHRYKQDNADFVTWGILKLEFSVDTSGRVRDLQITKNEANAMLAEFSLRAIRDADLPPMPADVAKDVGPKGLVIQYDIIIY